MSPKLLALLLALAAVAGGVFALSRQREAAALMERRPAKQEVAFFAFDPGAVARISAKWFDREATLRREGATWRFEKGGEGLDPAAAARLLEELAAARPQEYVKATPSQLAELQLVLPEREGWGGPGIVVALEDAAGQPLVRFLVGKHPGEGEGALDGASKGRYVARIPTSGPPDEAALIPPALEMVDDWVNRKNPPHPPEAPPAEPAEAPAQELDTPAEEG